MPILSYAALESPWCEEEITAAIMLSKVKARGGRPRIIPLLIENCQDKIEEDLPSLLTRLYVGFVGRYEDGLSDPLEKGFGLDHANVEGVRQARARQQEEAERRRQEQAEKERLARERAEQERIAREKAEAERAAREQARRERAIKVSELYRAGQQSHARKEFADAVKALESLLSLDASHAAALDLLAKARAAQAERERLAKEKAERERAAQMANALALSTPSYAEKTAQISNRLRSAQASFAQKKNDEAILAAQ